MTVVLLFMSRARMGVGQHSDDQLLRLLGACTAVCSCRKALLAAEERTQASWMHPSPLLGERLVIQRGMHAGMIQSPKSQVLSVLCLRVILGAFHRQVSTGPSVKTAQHVDWVC